MDAPISEMSPLQRARLKYTPTLPKEIDSFPHIRFSEDALDCTKEPAQDISTLFPHIKNHKIVKIKEHKNQLAPLRIGVVLSGGQAPGGHNVISGLFDALIKWHPESCLFGFLNGPNGIVNNQHIELTKDLIDCYRNQGGFDIIGSGRTKIETPEQFQACLHTTTTLNLDGLVIIGGDDSNTNALHIAEYFLSHQCKTIVVGAPKTIDGDLQNECIEISFGFDSACKTYAEIIGNIAKDALSAKKYYYFIKLMGRSASHITLECALKCQPNIAFISEEVKAKNWTLKQVVEHICALIEQRAAMKKHYGIILIPEGIIEFIPEFKGLIKELNSLLAPQSDLLEILEQVTDLSEKVQLISQRLTRESQACYDSLPDSIKSQLVMDRDPHGNVQVSKIETERLLIELVEKSLRLSTEAGTYKGSFSAQPFFCGYEGRSCLPSNFDADYCYSLGFASFLLIAGGYTGYISCIRHLKKDRSEWSVQGIPLISMMGLEQREGKFKPVIEKALVDLKGTPFKEFSDKRESWRLSDVYISPGPIQFFGPKEIVDNAPYLVCISRPS